MNHAFQQTQGMVDNRQIRATDNAENREDPAMAHDATAKDARGLPIRRVEHRAVGAGIYANADMTENRYRAERRELAVAQGKGLLDGDGTLHQRDVYALWAKSKTPAGVPSSAPTPVPTPTHRTNDRSHDKRRKHHPHR
jgi:hypothetical protein